ncbi:cytochrome c [Frigidibacter sp. SLM-1]|nr:cytochrome c [Frigidibacter sp. ROC022]MCR8723588.1 cytochrome c [Frigidibacter sp. ROC022]
MRRAILVLLVLGLIGLAAFWVITRPTQLTPDAIAGLTPDPVRGEYVFRAAGCASCHAAKDATGADLLKLGGGKAFPSEFGTFYAPNISPDPVHGIGNWTAIDLVNALQNGVGPDGTHLYPALPYGAYAKMTLQDVVSLRAYLATLPAVDTPSKPQDVSFPFSIRRALGGWKFLFLQRDFVIQDVPPEAETGRYIAEALAHCGECHTARNALGGLKTGQWLGGAPNPTGKGTIPNITPGKLDWSEADLVTFFQSGFTPEFDTAGGTMAEVVENLSTLPEADLVSLARYLKSVPAVTD